MKKRNLLALLFVLLFSTTSFSGCATAFTVTTDKTWGVTDDICPIYSGMSLDLYFAEKFFTWATGHGGATEEIVSFFFGIPAIFDFPLSLVLDTVLLPFTAIIYLVKGK